MWLDFLLCHRLHTSGRGIVMTGQVATCQLSDDSCAFAPDLS